MVADTAAGIDQQSTIKRHQGGCRDCCGSSWSLCLRENDYIGIITHTYVLTIYYNTHKMFLYIKLLLLFLHTLYLCTRTYFSTRTCKGMMILLAIQGFIQQQVSSYNYIFVESGHLYFQSMPSTASCSKMRKVVCSHFFTMDA